MKLYTVTQHGAPVTITDVDTGEDLLRSPRLNAVRWIERETEANPGSEFGMVEIWV